MIDLLYLALTKPIGIVVAFNEDRVYMRNKLYRVREKAADPALAELQFRFSPNSTQEIWIIKNGPRT